MHHTRYVQQVSAAEWRWVMLCSAVLLLLVMLPFALMPLALQPSSVFMGVAHAPETSAATLASTHIGMRGGWLWTALHTPEPQTAIIADVIYMLLGQLSRFTAVDPLVLFHVARALAMLFMCHALYMLAAAIWPRVTMRRIFWIIASVGAGLGWLLTPLLDQAPPDVQISAIFPLHGALSSVHLPLAVGLLAFLLVAMFDSLRPDSDDMPSITNHGLGVIVFSLALGLIYPSALGPVGVAYALALARGMRNASYQRNLTWFAWFVIPALLLPAYHMAVLLLNPLAMRVWEMETSAALPPLHLLVVALGLPLIIALPGIWRALRRLEQDGSVFMLVWMVSMVALAYLLPFVRGKFLFGLILPVAYFAVRAVGDFWLPQLRRRNLHFIAAAVAIPLMVGSQAVTLFAPLATAQSRVSLPPNYLSAFNFLQSRPQSVVLASPDVSIWLPAWSGMQVVYASPTLTLDATTKAAEVAAWYSATNPAQCDALLNGAYSVHSRYRVRYVLYGPLERQLGDSVCLDNLIEYARFGDVTLYRTGS